MNHHYFKKPLADVIASDYKYLKGQPFKTQFGDLPIDDVRVVEINSGEYNIVLFSKANVPFREIYEVLNITSIGLVEYLKMKNKKILPLGIDTYIEIDFKQVYYTEHLKQAQDACNYYAYLIEDRCKFKPLGSEEYYIIDFIKPLRIAEDKYQIVVGRNTLNQKVLNSDKFLTQDIVTLLNTSGVQQFEEKHLKDFIQLYL